MAVNAPKPELTLLIYHHLKQHGFLSAAEELQRHSPQQEQTVPVSLQDIYGSWLCESKKKKKSAKVKTKKAKSTTPTKKKNTATKAKKDILGKPSKGKSEGKINKTKRAKAQPSDKANGEASDSDSSLDVEKWKKLLLTMTEADAVKMESIDALDASAPPPAKKRVRKPRAKPPAKSDASSQKDNQAVEKKEEETETASTNITQKNTTTTNTPTSPGIEIQDSVSMSSPLKQIQVENKDILSTSGETSNQMPDAKKKKKKKKEDEMSETKTEASVNQTCDDGEGKEKNEVTVKTKSKASKKDKCEESTPEDQSGNNLEPVVKERKSKKKKTKPETEETSEKVEVKKTKKSKRSVDDEGNPRPLAEEVTEKAEEICDQKVKKKKLWHEGIANLMGEKSSDEKTEVKKVKKKKKKAVAAEGNQEQVAEEVKDDAAEKVEENQVSEQNCQAVLTSTDEVSENKGGLECVVTERKAKKKKRKSGHESLAELGDGPPREKKNREATQPNDLVLEEMTEANTSILSPSEGNLQENCEEATEPVPEVKKKKKRKTTYDEPEPPPALDTPSPPAEKKKKKSKLKSVEVPQSPAVSDQELPAAQSDSCSSKKKKKSSKRTES